MWKDKGLQLVMLPTENKVNALRGFSDRSLLFRYQENYQILESEGDLTCYYYLYLLSDEEIREGEIVLTDENSIERATGLYGNFPCDLINEVGGQKKVIATLDPSLNLPQFPSSFLEEYAKIYNSKKSLEVEVSYNVNSKYYDFYNGEQVNQYISAYKVKVDLNNTISILFKEEKKYSRGEVEELCGKAFDAGEAYRTGSCEGFKQIHPNKYEWIKENLK